MHLTTRVRIDQFWQRTFGAPSQQDGEVRVVTHGEHLAGYPGIYAVLRQGAVLITTPSEMTAHVRAWPLSPTTAMRPDWWTDRLPGWKVLGPSVHSFAGSHEQLQAAGSAYPASPAEVRAALFSRVSADEWEESGFAGDDVGHAWLLDNAQNRPVAAANLTPFDGVTADVGVLVAREARGHGDAVAAASAAVRYAVGHHGIARWRALETNSASLAVAARLGFNEDCRQLAARPV